MPKKSTKIEGIGIQQSLFDVEGKEENLEHIKIEDKTKKDYYDVKSTVMALENKNNERIYLFPSSSGEKDEWYKIGGRSALFYKYFLGPRMGRKDVRIRRDNDARVVFRYGVASVHFGERFMKLVDKLGYTVWKNQLGVIIVDLGQKFTMQEIKNMGNEARNETERMQMILMPTESMPGLYMKMRDLVRILAPKIKKMHPAYRETFGNKILDATTDLFMTYFQVANGVKDKATGKAELLESVSKVSGVLAMIDEMELFDVITRTKFGERVIEIREEIKKNFKDDEEGKDGGKDDKNNEDKKPCKKD